MDQATPASGDIASTPSASVASPAITPDSTQTAAPATQATPNPITDSTHGEPPKERWPDILNNQRAAAKAEALKEWREQYGWAESVKREDLAQMAEWYGRYQGDPSEFLEKAYQEALAHPVHGATVKSRVGKLLASMRQQQADAEPDFEPDVPVMNDQGQVVSRTYSADLVKQLIAHEVGKATQPFQQDLDTRKTQAQKAEEKAKAEAQADEDIQYVKALPLFEEHKADILGVFQANPRMTFRQAYDEVLKTKILPGYGQKAEAKVLSDLQQKAHAQTVNPGTPSGSAKPKFKDFAEAHAYYETHPEEAAAMAQR